MWRRKWIIVLVTVVATGAAFGFSYRQAKVYQAQADLIYEQSVNVANPLTGQSYTDPTQRTAELDSVNAIIQSPTIAQRAANSSSSRRGCPRPATRSGLRSLRTRAAPPARSRPTWSM